MNCKYEGRCAVIYIFLQSICVDVFVLESPTLERERRNRIKTKKMEQTHTKEKESY